MYYTPPPAARERTPAQLGLKPPPNYAFVTGRAFEGLKGFRSESSEFSCCRCSSKSETLNPIASILASRHEEVLLGTCQVWDARLLSFRTKKLQEEVPSHNWPEILQPRLPAVCRVCSADSKPETGDSMLKKNPV